MLIMSGCCAKHLPTQSHSILPGYYKYPRLYKGMDTTVENCPRWHSGGGHLQDTSDAPLCGFHHYVNIAAATTW